MRRSRSRALELEQSVAHELVLLAGAAVVPFNGGRVVIDKLVLDTGLPWPLLAPDRALQSAQLEEPSPTMVYGLGSREGTYCQQGVVQLELGRWRLRVTAVIGAHSRDWLLGYPVLRHFDLLLRERPRRPYPRMLGPADVILPIT